MKKKKQNKKGTKMEVQGIQAINAVDKKPPSPPDLPEASQIGTPFFAVVTPTGKISSRSIATSQIEAIAKFQSYGDYFSYLEKKLWEEREKEGYTVKQLVISEAKPIDDILRVLPSPFEVLVRFPESKAKKPWWRIW